MRLDPRRLSKIIRQVTEELLSGVHVADWTRVVAWLSAEPIGWSMHLRVQLGDGTVLEDDISLPHRDKLTRRLQSLQREMFRKPWGSFLSVMVDVIVDPESPGSLVTAARFNYDMDPVEVGHAAAPMTVEALKGQLRVYQRASSTWPQWMVDRHAGRPSPTSAPAASSAPPPLTGPPDDHAERLRTLTEWLMYDLGVQPGWDSITLWAKPTPDAVVIRVLVAGPQPDDLSGTFAAGSTQDAAVRDLQRLMYRKPGGTWLSARFMVTANGWPTPQIATDVEFNYEENPGQFTADDGPLTAEQVAAHLRDFPRSAEATPEWMREAR